MEGYRRVGGGGRMGEQGIRSINGRYKVDGEVKNSMGNGEMKELTCTTHGHELTRRNDGGSRVQGRGE